MKRFSTLDITRAFGVAPSTGSVIASLLNGEITPGRHRSLHPWPLFDMEVPPPVQQVLLAVCDMLELAPSALRQRGDVTYLDMGDTLQPTISWNAASRRYVIGAGSAA